MAQNNKPEWFEIIDNDEKPGLRKVSKSLPVSAALVTALILGIGAVVAQSPDQTQVSAVVTIEQQGQSSQATSALTSTTTTAAVGVAAVAGNKLANPAISQLPTSGDDDEDNDDDDHDGRGHDDDDDEDEDDD